MKAEIEMYYNVVAQANCKHDKVTQQSNRRVILNILHGLVITKDVCPTCHKVLYMSIEKLEEVK